VSLKYIRLLFANYILGKLGEMSSPLEIIKVLVLRGARGHELLSIMYIVRLRIEFLLSHAGFTGCDQITPGS
jgi:hypothetical protein